MSFAAAAVGTGALAFWVVGVSGVLGYTTNVALFSAGTALLLVARLGRR